MNFGKKHKNEKLIIVAKYSLFAREKNGLLKDFKQFSSIPNLQISYSAVIVSVVMRGCWVNQSFLPKGQLSFLYPFPIRDEGSFDKTLHSSSMAKRKFLARAGQMTLCCHLSQLFTCVGQAWLICIYVALLPFYGLGAHQLTHETLLWGVRLRPAGLRSQALFVMGAWCNEGHLTFLSSPYFSHKIFYPCSRYHHGC